MSDDPDQPTAEPDDDPATPTTATGAPKRTVPAGAFVIAVMAAMALGILAVFALATAGDGSGGGDDQDVRLAAGRFAERFLTFEHDGLDDWKADVLRLSTGGFAGEVEDVEAGLRRLIGEDELDAVTQVNEVFVGEPDRGAVEAVVVYDRDLQGASFSRSETDRYVQLSLLRVDGEWLVDNVIDIASASDVGSTGGTSTTTAPPTTAAEAEAPPGTEADPEVGDG